MGKIFLYGQSQEKTDTFAKLTVYCPLDTIVRATSIGTPIVLEAVSINGVAVFKRITEGEWDITFENIEHYPARRIKINSLDYEIFVLGSIKVSSTDEILVVEKPDDVGSGRINTYVQDGVLVAYENLEETFYDDVKVYISNNILVTSYFTATINVSYPAGSVCAVTDGNIMFVPPDASGEWVCVIPSTGTWTITSTYGDKTASTQVVITTDGQTESVDLDYFEAIINVTYPVGSTCTASNGSITLLAPDITGTWTCVVPCAGTWTLKCVDGAKSFSVDVDINTDDGTHTVDLNYPVIAYSTVEDMLSDNSRPDYTVAIISNTSVSSWVYTDISSPEPDDPLAGLVWGMLYGDKLVSAKHYISDVWIDVPVYVCYGGEWYNFVAPQYLYKSGDEFTDITGGFSSVNILRRSSYSSLTVDTVQKNADHIYLKASSNYQASIASTNKIDITNYSKLTMVVNGCSIQSSTVTGGNTLMLVSSRTDASTAVASATIRDGLTEISLDGISGTYYVVAAVHGVSDTNYVYVTEIYLS